MLDGGPSNPSSLFVVAQNRVKGGLWRAMGYTHTALPPWGKDIIVVMGGGVS